MSAPRETLIQEALRWMRFAAEDLTLAREAHLLPSGCPARLVCFNAQQSAEKCLKAYLVLRGVTIPKTHNIALLRELCGEHDAWPLEISGADALSRFSVNSRYPGDDAEVSGGDAERAVALASAVYEAVLTALKKDGVRADRKG